MGLIDSVIGTSSHISGLCHSVVRGELFTTCSSGCIYCYARWYRGPHGRPKARFDIFKLLKSLGELVGRGIPVIPVRFSALSDPFQPPAKVTLKALKMALKLRIPIILNTKLQPGEAHLKVMESLAAEGLLLLQVSITGLDEAAIRRLEPFASPVEERLRLVEWASEIGIPTIVRIQPFIPGLSDRNVEGFLDEIASAGARMVIVEFLRIERGFLDFFRRLFPGNGVYMEEWESYLPRTPSDEAPLLQAPFEYRLKIATRIAKEAVKRGLAFATCKEGLFHLHEPKTLDCCGMGFLEAGWTRRQTLWDLYLEAYEKGRAKPGDLWGRCEREGLLCRERMKVYPGWLRRGLRVHEKRLEGLLKKPSLVEKIAPALRFENGFYVPKN
ncbi:radical SAM protein [Pyrococcus yayanosii]|uniref:Radical SAM domain protein n=1 Tax=Pyrococcus yayanosii (strain CH1 / JCM 16557) TaxID=529709 RepID=F8AF04_PYRYC|nr:radical SAM protein [Pyrococcus yayanosii]AEH24841.1 radical SAM domain protein [Pyrococcus yayanosii CH1]